MTQRQADYQVGLPVVFIHPGQEDVRTSIGSQISNLIAHRLVDALPNYVLPDEASQARISILLARLKQTRPFS